MPQHTAATMAKRLLHQAAQRLGTVDPRPAVGDIIEESLAVPLGDPVARRERLLEPSFSETAPDHLSFLVTGAGPGFTPSDRVESATQALYRVTRNNFGPDAAHWLDSRLEAAKSRGHKRSVQWGASFGSAFDRDGVTEASVHYEFGPMLMDALPAPLHRITQLAMTTLPGLRPALSTLRCGRSSGSQQVTFAVERALALNDLRPLMDALGIGHQHPSLMSALAFVLGARFTLPPDTALITLRPTRAGVELRLDVDLDALPDPPAQLMALMRLQMTERPSGVRALDRWLMALTPDGYPGPGTVSVLSSWVRPDMPARLALYLRPASLQGNGDDTPVVHRYEAERAAVPAAAVSPAVAAEAAWASSAWMR
jgi:hypothetical protein